MRTRLLYALAVVSLAAIALVASAGAAGGGPEATVTGVSPTTATVGQKLTVLGMDLGGTTAISIGDVPVTRFAVDAGGSSVVFDVPTGVHPGSAMVVLTVNGAQYSTGPVTIGSGSTAPQALPTAATPGAPANVKVAPRIVLFSPAAAKVGSKVTIYGHNFVGVSWVKVGGHTASFHVLSKNRLWLTV